MNWKSLFIPRLNNTNLLNKTQFPHIINEKDDDSLYTESIFEGKIT